MPTSPEDYSSPSILIVAAEASSCMYAKNFLEEWRLQNADWQFFGVGDREMEASGMKCMGLAEDLAVVGLQEVFTHWTDISKTFNEILTESKKRKPRFALLLDYPGFNLRLAAKLKGLGIPVVYYISPQLWAWKKGRVRGIRKNIDEMLVVFPFEVDFYKKYGVTAHFVGHPLLEVIEKERRGLKVDLSDSVKILGLMPGSRKSEIKFNLKTQIQAALIMQKNNPNLLVKILVAPTLDLLWLKELVGDIPSHWVFEQDAPTKMILGCHLLLSASGTATLQIALCGRPMVVMYKMKPVTAFLAKLLVRSVDYFCIVNLIAGRQVVPEYFQEMANPQTLAESLQKYLSEPNHYDKSVAELRDVGVFTGTR